MLERIRNGLRIAGWTALRGLLLLLGLLLLIAAGELWFRPLSAEGGRLLALLAAGCGIGFLSLQWAFFRLYDRFRRLRRVAARLRLDLLGRESQVRALDHRRRCLARRVEELSAQAVIDTATLKSDSFDDFMSGMANIARSHNFAQELTVFACEQEEPLPLGSCQISKAAELCLTFSGGGAAVIARDIFQQGGINPARLSACSMHISEQGLRVVVNGELLYAGAPAGRLRLTLNGIDPQNPPERDSLRRQVALRLAGVSLDGGGIREALHAQGPVAAPGGAGGLMRLASVMSCGENRLGVVRMGFHTGEEANLYLLQKALKTTADRVAQVLRHERIYEMAIKDGLTGLFNKRHMMTVFERQFSQAQRHGGALCMILIDIDHFKKVNDTWGHLTGDVILREVSALLLENARASDLPCRYGGEELVIILPEEQPQTAARVAERLRTAIERREFISDTGKPLHVTASFGVAGFQPSMTRAEDLIAAADQALYEAKHGGRNRVVLARQEAAPISALA